MDRIVEALERAKQEQGRRAPAPVEILRETPARRPGEPEAKIVYTLTRSRPVPPEVLRRNRVITADQHGAAADAYKILCTQVLRRMRERGFNALAVVSPGAKEGKTLTAINLAISLSREVGHTVLLVDADLRNPAVHRYFEIDAEPGLSEHLVDGIGLHRVLVNPGISNLVVLPGGRPLRDSAEMLASARMRSLVQELKARYTSRTIVFDLPPVLSAADTMAFSPLVDASIMVVEEGRTAPDDILRAAEMLESANLIGTVLNNSRSGPSPEQGPAASRTQRRWSWWRRRPGI